MATPSLFIQVAHGSYTARTETNNPAGEPLEAADRDVL